MITVVVVVVVAVCCWLSVNNFAVGLLVKFNLLLLLVLGQQLFVGWCLVGWLVFSWLIGWLVFSWLIGWLVLFVAVVAAAVWSCW